MRVWKHEHFDAYPFTLMLSDGFSNIGNNLDRERINFDWDVDCDHDSFGRIYDIARIISWRDISVCIECISRYVTHRSKAKSR